MNVLHVIPRLGLGQGGLRSAVFGLRHALEAAGARCTVATLECEPDDDVLCFARSRPLMTWASRELARWLGAHVAEFDAVIAHSMWFTPSRLAFASARKAGVPFWLHPHGMLDPDALDHHRLRKLVRWTTGDRALVRGARLIFSNEAERDRASARVRFDRARADVVANPVDPELFDLPRKPASPPMILCLNRLHPRKGVLQWIEALRVLDAHGVGFRALHAGARQDARYAARVEAAARPLVRRGLLELRGPEHDVRPLLGQAALVVHPATGFENFGMVAAEGLAAGAAVICSPRALIAAQLEGAAVVVDPAPDALADAMARLLRYAAAREAMAARGREYARRNFAPEIVGARLLEILRSHVETPARA